EEVQVLTERWRKEYNHVRPHSALGYRSPVPETILVRQPILELVTLT
ncbi:MAG: transposase, partial [Chloroflexi bacterium]|nr:transposase [Chloroflexota bacterium]